MVGQAIDATAKLRIPSLLAAPKRFAELASECGAHSLSNAVAMIVPTVAKYTLD
jgi:hypothetical protein